MTYRTGSSLDGRHYWLTPPELRKAIDELYGCTFDPCPYPRPADFDGLEVPWQSRNFVNPPFDNLRAWCSKALAEYRAGRSSVLLVPVKQWEMDLFSSASRLIALGRVRWLATEDGTPQRSGKGWPILAVVLDAGRSLAEGPVVGGKAGACAQSELAGAADLRAAYAGPAADRAGESGVGTKSVCEMPGGPGAGAVDPPAADRPTAGRLAV
jgi:hypothetical protein